MTDCHRSLQQSLSIDERNTARAAGGGAPVVDSDALREANNWVKLVELV